MNSHRFFPHTNISSDSDELRGLNRLINPSSNQQFIVFLNQHLHVTHVVLNFLRINLPCFFSCEVYMGLASECGTHC